MHAKTALAVTAVMAAWVMNGPLIRAASYTGGLGDGYDEDAMTNDVYLSTLVTLSSAENRSFTRAYAPVSIGTITIADDPVTPVITSGTLVLSIPAGFGMTWDETDTTATFGGSAASKANTTVSYAGSNKKLLVAVTNGFSAGDTLAISGLSFKNHIGFGTTRLELDYDDDGITDALDDKTITILEFYTGGPGDAYAMGQMSQDNRLYRPPGTLFLIR